MISIKSNRQFDTAHGSGTLWQMVIGGFMLLASTSTFAQASTAPALPKVRLQAGMHLIQAEVAATPEQRETGLMNRRTLAPNSGMLFAFSDKAYHCFWMKNTHIPLSIAFVDDNGLIVSVTDMAPLDETSHCPKAPVRYALEMNQGWFAKRGLAEGQKLSGEPFSTR